MFRDRCSLTGEGAPGHGGLDHVAVEPRGGARTTPVAGCAPASTLTSVASSWTVAPRRSSIFGRSPGSAVSCCRPLPSKRSSRLIAACFALSPSPPGPYCSTMSCAAQQSFAGLLVSYRPLAAFPNREPTTLLDRGRVWARSEVAFLFVWRLVSAELRELARTDHAGIFLPEPPGGAAAAADTLTRTGARSCPP